jgi:hypothetical protein
MPYFWLRELADFHPDATCSPCLWRKLFAVDAVAFKSEADTLDGSLRKLLAVLSAACLSAHDVPVAGASAGDFGPVILANRFCSSFICDPGPAATEGGVLVFELEFCRGGTGGDGFARGGTGGEAVRPMPRPGTDTPA